MGKHDRYQQKQSADINSAEIKASTEELVHQRFVFTETAIKKFDGININEETKLISSMQSEGWEHYYCLILYGTLRLLYFRR